MYSPFLLSLCAFFLGCNLLLALGFLWRRYGCSLLWVPIRPAVFLAVSAAVVAAGFAVTLFIGFDHIDLSFAIGAALALSLCHPMIALSSFLSMLFLRPWELMPYNEIITLLPRTFAVICLASWVYWWAVRKSLVLRWDNIATLFILFILWLPITAILNGDIGQAVNDWFTNFLPIVVIFLLILSAVQHAEDLKLVTITIVSSIIGVVVMAIATTSQLEGFAALAVRLGGIGLFGNANDIAALLALALPLIIVPAYTRNIGFRTRIVASCALTVGLIGLFLSQSRGALLALVAAGAVYLFSTKKSVHKYFVVGVVLLCLPIFFYRAMTRAEADTELSGMARWNYAVTGLKMLKSSPLWGVGYGNYPQLFSSYTSVFFETGERTAHSSWVLIMAEGGIVGLVLFSLLFVAVLKRASKIRHRAPEYIAACVGYGIAMSFLSHTYIFVLYVLYALIVVAERILTTAQGQEVTK